MGLDSSVYQLGKNVLVQLTLISSSALALALSHFCPIIFCSFGSFLFFFFFVLFFVLKSAVGPRLQCLGTMGETLNVFIERFH